MIRRRALLALAALAAGRAAAQTSDEFAAARERLRAAIERDARETGSLTGRRELDPRVMAAIDKVPRHAFVPADQKRHAYENRPLSIGHGQTISQPFIVALMTDIMDIKPTDRVLEIGTGSGYQAAVLAELAAAVYTIEIVEPLGRQAAATLQPRSATAT